MTILKSKNIKLIGLFFLVFSLSYFGFNNFFPVQSKIPDTSALTDESVDAGNQPQTGYINFSGPKTQVCPLNGALHTQAEADIWSTRRPLMVMIENHSDSRPQSGLSNADIIYEAVAEGGITRFMAVFYCAVLRGSSQKYDVGPVRSARSYFLDLASEYGDFPLYTHVGGANCSAPKDEAGQSLACTTDRRAMAVEQISQYGWMNKGSWSDLSQFSLSYRVCRREPDRTGETWDTEHSMYCSTDKLWETAAEDKRGVTNITSATGKTWDSNFKLWSFNQPDSSSASDIKNITFDFWPGFKQYTVSWQYDSLTNSYLRFNSGEKQIDFNNQEVLTAKNIIIQFVKETQSVDIHQHNLYQTIGRGTGILFQNGSKADITWTKASRTARTSFKDKSGKDINFVPGQIWIELLPIGNDVSYEN